MAAGCAGTGFDEWGLVIVKKKKMCLLVKKVCRSQ